MLIIDKMTSILVKQVMVQALCTPDCEPAEGISLRHISGSNCPTEMVRVLNAAEYNENHI